MSFSRFAHLIFVGGVASALVAGCGSSSSTGGGSGNDGGSSTTGTGTSSGNDDGGSTSSGTGDSGGTVATGNGANCGTATCTSTQYCVLNGSTDASGNTTWTPANQCAAIPTTCTPPTDGDSTDFCSCLEKADTSCPTTGAVVTQCNEDSTGTIDFGCSASSI